MENINDYKYVCEKCNYRCNIVSRWDKHINTVLHITGKKKIRSDFKGERECEKCEYKTLNTYSLKEHILNYHCSINEREKEFKFYCKLCDYGTFSKDIIEKHNNTKKHKRHISLN
jgi:hypothetical protein